MGEEVLLTTNEKIRNKYLERVKHFENARYSEEIAKHSAALEICHDNYISLEQLEEIVNAVDRKDICE